MRFGSTEIPGSLFKLARDRMLAGGTFTPVDVRTHLLEQGASVLQETSPLAANHWLVANRVFQAARDELKAAGQVTQVKRGLWAKTN